eukprot:CAMPEP_0201570996 /NCGR_PEP_ID=MMETSP0190_2-20130828/13541_1 /ASSEMBLY_ACC=CAM_ASM_000263 /TAXON_ID=37353 /ORGANISM="Rosalina sp." /LENGTH=158 /DNA_ID=CAMNT_0047995185 /DNA_START=31 /DNA_END=504 /DNA_ORIENTATION=-
MAQEEKKAPEQKLDPLFQPEMIALSKLHKDKIRPILGKIMKGKSVKQKKLNKCSGDVIKVLNNHILRLIQQWNKVKTTRKRGEWLDSHVPKGNINGVDTHDMWIELTNFYGEYCDEENMEMIEARENDYNYLENNWNEKDEYQSISGINHGRIIESDW